MSRKKPPKDIRDRRKPKPATEKVALPRKSLLLRLAKSPWLFVGALATIASALSLMPRISLAPTGSLRARDPMGTVFAISNDGILPLHDVHARCVLDDLRSGPLYIHGIAITAKGTDAEILSPGQQLTLPCYRVNMAQARVANVTVRVDYKPNYLWWERTIRFSMEAMQSDDGTWVWKRLPR
jgi:hypothetical protein